MITSLKRGTESGEFLPSFSFTLLESPAIYGVDDINKASIPYRKGEVKAPSFLTGFTALSQIQVAYKELIETLCSPRNSFLALITASDKSCSGF